MDQFHKATLQDNAFQRGTRKEFEANITELDQAVIACRQIDESLAKLYMDAGYLLSRVLYDQACQISPDHLIIPPQPLSARSPFTNTLDIATQYAGTNSNRSRRVSFQSCLHPQDYDILVNATNRLLDADVDFTALAYEIHNERYIFSSAVCKLNREMGVWHFFMMWWKDLVTCSIDDVKLVEHFEKWRDPYGRMRQTLKSQPYARFLKAYQELYEIYTILTEARMHKGEERPGKKPA
ncbi:hypothetical protein BJ508DRAFT_320816 [Ascobolus immersus RN42]|uniref:Uncharacterized protein n=1 Tax=Ascobolus immersus RN42 TaxID=1160509 RepID=A0A3N4IUE5_ASCIM|nr:hypothetical protein BJ508DRAFT_320816 [Ascobolus immersus RN42]